MGHGEPEELTRARRRVGRRRWRRWLALGGSAVVLAAAVPLLARDGSGKELAVRTDSSETGDVPPETNGSSVEATTAPAVGPAESTTSAPTTDLTVSPAGRRPPGPATSTTSKRLTSPSTVSTTPVTAPVVPATTGTTRPACPPPPVSPWTITTPGIHLVPIDGRAPQPVPVPSGLEPDSITASPDGMRLVFSDRDPAGPNQYNYTYTIYTAERDGSDLQRIHHTDMSPSGFVWSPDGRWIAYTAQGSGSNLSSIFLMAPDGSQHKQLWTYPVPGNGLLRWSPDSTRIAAPNGNDGAGAWVVDRATGASLHVVKEAAGDLDWSPDSKRLAVALIDGSPPTMGGGPRQQFPTIVINADGTDRREIADGYNAPSWSPAGDGIALRNGSLIDPDTLVRRSYGLGTARAYAADGEHLLATSPGLLINDRRGCGFQLVVTDFSRTSPTFVGWAGTGQILVRVLPPI